MMSCSRRLVFFALVALFGMHATSVVTARVDEPAVRATKKNTLNYDHLWLRSQPPNADKDKDSNDDAALRVVEVADGDYFQVVFKNTFPSCFTYTIAIIDKDPDKAASQLPGQSVMAVSRKDLRDTSVTMRHRAGISRYRVSATLSCQAALEPAEAAELVAEMMSRSGEANRVKAATARNRQKATLWEAPEIVDFAEANKLPLSRNQVQLRGVEFDLYVRTALEWELTLLGGVAWQNFGGNDYFIKKTSTEQLLDGKTQTVDSLTVEQKPVATGRRAGAMTLASVYPPIRLPRSSPRLGVAFGFGGDGGDLRYYTGVSVDAGKHLTFSAGRVFGSLKALPLGQEIGQKPISENVLANLRDVPASAWYFGVALGFDIKSAPDFTDGFKSATTSTPEVAEKPATTALSGTFATEKGDFVVVSPFLNGVMLHIGGENIALPVRKGLVFTEQSGVQSATFTILDGKDRPSEVKLTGGSSEFTAKLPVPLASFGGTYAAGTDQYVVAARDSTLTVVLPDKTKVELRRTKNLAFTSDTPKLDVEFLLTDDKVTGLRHGAVTATRQ